MKFTKQTKFILAVSLQVIVILVIIVSKLAIVGSGSTVLLRIEPVDPRDMLRGDYLQFQYSNVSNINSYMFDSQTIRNGDTVYILLHQDGSYWTATNAYHLKPENPEGILLKGKITRGGMEGNFDLPSLYTDSGNRTLHIVYGIEEYFIPEGKGNTLNLRNTNNTYAEVVVNAEGNAVLKRILVDGKPWP